MEESGLLRGYERVDANQIRNEVDGSGVGASGQTGPADPIYGGAVDVTRWDRAATLLRAHRIVAARPGRRAAAGAGRPLWEFTPYKGHPIVLRRCRESRSPPRARTRNVRETAFCDTSRRLCPRCNLLETAHGPLACSINARIKSALPAFLTRCAFRKSRERFCCRSYPPRNIVVRCAEPRGGSPRGPRVQRRAVHRPGGSGLHG